VELETALADTKRQLAEAQAAPRPVEAAKAAPEADPTDLSKRLAETEDKLATSLRGYAVLEKERDAQAAEASKLTANLAAEKNSLAAQVSALSVQVDQLKTNAQDRTSSAQTEAARLNEALTALQRSTAQNTNDLAATRAVLQQVQGANTVLANENYQLKTRLARIPGAAAPAPAAPVATPVAIPAVRTHVVVAGDSLSRLSQLYYGTSNRWQDIYNANRGKLGSDGVLHVGVELRIP
jgi:nucleoid-associated protein YgaU